MKPEGKENLLKLMGSLRFMAEIFSENSKKKIKKEAWDVIIAMKWFSYIQIVIKVLNEMNFIKLKPIKLKLNSLFFIVTCC